MVTDQMFTEIKCLLRSNVYLDHTREELCNDIDDMRLCSQDVLCNGMEYVKYLNSAHLKFDKKTTLIHGCECDQR